MKARQIIVVGLAGAACLAVFIGLFGKPETGEDRVARIKAGCEREYRHLGESEVSNCQAKLLLEALAEADSARLDRARR